MTRQLPMAPPASWWLRMGHDLRGPVAPIRMAVQILRMDSMDSSEQANCLKLLDRQLDLLLANIEDMSELLRINAGRFEFNPVTADLGDCFELLEGRSVLKRELELVGATLVTVPWPSPLVARHDPDRLATLLEFLVSRFARCGVRGGTVRLALAPGPGIALWTMEADVTGLADDTEFQYVLGNSSAVDNCEARALLARELVVLHGLQFLCVPSAKGIAFSMAIET